MKTIAIIGSGPLGLWTAEAIVSQDPTNSVVIGNTKGIQPQWLPPLMASPANAGRVRYVKVDASKESDLINLATGAQGLVHCANPQYYEWAEKLPPIQKAAIAAALHHKIPLVCADNLYAYGNPKGEPLSEASPLAPSSKKGAIRKDLVAMLQQAEKDQGLLWTTAQGSDYFGPGSRGQSNWGERFYEPMLASKAAMFIGSTKTKHSFVYTPDFGKAMAALVLSSDPGVFGRSWIVPPAMDGSIEDLAPRFYAEARKQGMVQGSKALKVGKLPKLMIRLLGLFNKVVAELPEMAYQWDNDFISRGDALVARLGVKPTDTNQAIRETVASWAFCKS